MHKGDVPPRWLAGVGAAIDEFLALGLETVTIAGSYHAGKFLRPHGKAGKVYFPEDGTAYFPGGFTAAVVDSVHAMGYGTSGGGVGLANAIMRVPGGWHGVSDPRASGFAVGY